MIKVKNLTFWQNNSKRHLLQEYRNNVLSYFQKIEYNEFSRNIQDTEESQPIRRQLNKSSNSIEEIFRMTGVNTVLQYTPPPAIGGYIQNIDVISNIFNLQNFYIEPKCILDFIDQADGILEDDFIHSIIRTFNPFFWLSRLIEFISNIPFMIIGNIGLNQKKAEKSVIGRLIKELIKLISWVLTLWQFGERLKIIPETFDLLKLIGDKL